MTDTIVIDPNDLPLDVPDGDDGDDRTNDESADEETP